MPKPYRSNEIGDGNQGNKVGDQYADAVRVLAEDQGRPPKDDPVNEVDDGDVAAPPFQRRADDTVDEEPACVDQPEPEEDKA